MAVEVGQEAPDFTLKNPDNEDVTLSSFRGRKNVVLVFFPLAFSGNCTKQLTEVQDSSARYPRATPRCSASRSTRATSRGGSPRSWGSPTPSCSPTSNRRAR